MPARPPAKMSRAFAAALCLVALLAGPARADTPIGAEAAARLPIFDAHMHYNDDAWGPYPPDKVLDLMDRHGVALALVSATPDPGAIRLKEFAPARMVAELRPYHGGLGQAGWTFGGDAVMDYLTKRLDRYGHAGIGEIHVWSMDGTDLTVLDRVARLAEGRKLIVHLHSGHEPLSALFRAAPDLTVLWAHAGMSEPTPVIARMLDAHPRLFAELSYREQQVLAGDGGLNPLWWELLVRHKDRFLLGSDTWSLEQWDNYGDLIAQHRRILAGLPRDAAEAIAFRNAERLYGRPVSRDLIGRR